LGVAEKQGLKAQDVADSAARRCELEAFQIDPIRFMRFRQSDGEGKLATSFAVLGISHACNGS